MKQGRRIDIRAGYGQLGNYLVVGYFDETASCQSRFSMA